MPDSTKINVASVPVRPGNARQSIHPTDASPWAALQRIPNAGDQLADVDAARADAIAAALIALTVGERVADGCDQLIDGTRTIGVAVPAALWRWEC
jgi:hypothetical protein